MDGQRTYLAVLVWELVLFFSFVCVRGNHSVAIVKMEIKSWRRRRRGEKHGVGSESHRHSFFLCQAFLGMGALVWVIDGRCRERELWD
jgi:hypothetical protein